MADTKIKHRHQFISGESLAMGSSAEDIASAGGTIPGNAGRIHFFVPTGDNVHWAPSETPTSTYGNPVKAGNWGVLEPGQQGAKLISDDASDVTLVIIYERGSGRADNGGSVSAPY